ncbi:MAG: glycosyltransferase, partial [Candidatus Aenigmarchaeota archaeon]|nr:glycosyltransferase [Candidatus Aenigmarchaeota archaeon]
MKIAMIFPGFSRNITGGAGGLLLHLCDELIKKGNEVTLITTEIGEIWKSIIPDKLEIITIGRVIKTGNRDLDLFLQHYDVARMHRYLNNNFDIINIHNYPSPIASALAKKLKGLNTPVVYQCNEPPRFLYDLHKETIKNSSIVKKIGISIFTPLLKKLDKWGVSKVDEIISISKFMQRYIKEIYKRNNSFIMPGIEIDRFRPDIDGNKVRSKYAK